ncbi:glucose-6-phosphate isomerase, partial [Pseudonocardia sp. SID8383]|nr:glucose-6-phosphate isomerase [Pseudonocardia sp. SID8383]
DAVAAARVVAGTDPGGARLTALDSADPVQVAEALSGELAETVLVVADAAGTDPVVAAVTRVVAAAIAEEVGADALAARTVHLTEPGSPLDTPGDPGPVVVTLDADVPGRFGVLGPL